MARRPRPGCAVQVGHLQQAHCDWIKEDGGNDHEQWGRDRPEDLLRRAWRRGQRACQSVEGLCGSSRHEKLVYEKDKSHEG